MYDTTVYLKEGFKDEEARIIKDLREDMKNIKTEDGWVIIDNKHSRRKYRIPISNVACISHWKENLD